MKVAIIEDEPLAIQHLTGLIYMFDASIEIVYKCDSVKKAVKWFQSSPTVDLVFLDIQLADGLSFDIFDKASVSTPIIFTTAYNEYAIRAFKVNSVDYLLKPIDQEELTNAMQKFQSWRSKPLPQADTLQKLAQLLGHKEPTKERFIVKVGEHIHSIPMEEVSFFYSQEKATFIQTTNHRRYLIDYSLEHLEQVAPKNRFFRINRAFFISFEAITDIISYSNSRLKVKLNQCDDDNVIVSRDRVASFKKWLDR
ncbi:MAG: LytR/AlgR family response regulator transcription factor [Cyclobacteriaceae bacterium]